MLENLSPLLIAEWLKHRGIEDVVIIVCNWAEGNQEGRMEGREGWTDGRKEGWTDGMKEGRTYGKNERREGKMDGWKE
ncbi:hypothetical protein CEXT_417231 [Caerostris extrusa]|uniref:Uncharacterized protein n=1 Tax=Caerostris extrusa TaxID=172846 RepID=A0AAV4QFR9_CAEEX|nr:hypothetical protein CEXT_417231 [Caerostris extrusa]